MNNLSQSVHVHNELRARLLREFPDLHEDEAALIDTLEGISDLNDAIVAVWESAADDDAMCAAIDDRIKTMKERFDRICLRSQRKRAIIQEAMEEAGIKKIESAVVTLSIRNNPAKVIITDDALIPEQFHKVKTIESIDIAAIKEAMKDGQVVPGATLSNGSQSLAARVK